MKTKSDQNKQDGPLKFLIAYEKLDIQGYVANNTVDNDFLKKSIAMELAVPNCGFAITSL